MAGWTDGDVDGDANCISLPAAVTSSCGQSCSPRPTCRRSHSLTAGGCCLLPQLRASGLDAARVRRIFVTHMHGDHCFGVGGVIAAVNEVGERLPRVVR